MNLSERLGYSIGLAIAIIAITVLPLMIGAADGIDLLPKATFDFVFSPWYPIAAYVLAFLLAPWARQYLHDRDAGTDSSLRSKLQDGNLPFFGGLSSNSASWPKVRVLLAIVVVVVAVGHFLQSFVLQ